MQTTTLVLLPGLDGTGVLFDEFVAALPGTIATQVISYPGDTALTYRELLGYVRERLPAGPFAVLGESFSGPLALALGAEDARVAAVILCASFVSNPLRCVPRHLARFLFPLWFRLFPAFVRSKALLGGYSSAPLNDALARAHRRVSAPVLAARAREILRVSATDDLRRCAAPILYLMGDGDGVVRRHNAAAIKALRPSVRVVSIPAPHLVLQAAPTLAAAAVVEFLASAAPSNQAHAPDAAPQLSSDIRLLPRF